MKLLVITVLTACAIVCAYLYFGDRDTSTPVSRSLVTGSVVSVIDGDTFKLKVGSKIIDVDMIGIDAPEMGQRFAAHARDYFSELTESREVVVEVYRVDGYGKLYGELILGGISINKLMLTDGYVWAAPESDEHSFWTELEHVARNNRFGLWRDEKVVPPWEFREQFLSLSATGTR